MKSKYLGLNQVIRDLISLCEIPKEIMQIVFKKDQILRKYTANSKTFNDIISEENESSIPKSKVCKDNHA